MTTTRQIALGLTTALLGLVVMAGPTSARDARIIQFGTKLNFSTAVKGDLGTTAGQGKLVGKLTGADGRPVAGAVIILAAGQILYKATSATDGSFVFAALPASAYEVTLASGALAALEAGLDGKQLKLTAAAAAANPSTERHVRFGFKFYF